MRLRVALAMTSLALGMGAACGYGGDATGNDAGIAPSEAGGGAGTDALSSDDAHDVPLGDAGISLTVTQTAPPSMVDLTAEGTLGWIRWDLYNNPPAYVTMMTAPNAIPTFTSPAASAVKGFTNFATQFRWSNGGTAGQYGDDSTFVYLLGPAPPSFHLALPASAHAQRLVLYAGVFAATALLTVTLAGQIVAPPAFDNGDNGYVRYAIDFSAATPASLEIEWMRTNDHDNQFSNLTLAAATLAPMP